jgi:hypothetical protein
VSTSKLSKFVEHPVTKFAALTMAIVTFAKDFGPYLPVSMHLDPAGRALIYIAAEPTTGWYDTSEAYSPDVAFYDEYFTPHGSEVIKKKNR